MLSIDIRTTAVGTTVDQIPELDCNAKGLVHMKMKLTCPNQLALAAVLLLGLPCMKICRSYTYQ